MRRNDKSNRIIQWIVGIGHFILLNVLIIAFMRWHWRMATWPIGGIEMFFLVNNTALLISLIKFSTSIHQRMVGAGEIIRHVILGTSLYMVVAYLLMKIFAWKMAVGWLILEIGVLLMILLLLKSFLERWFIKLYRQGGRNTRTVTLVGSDPELIGVYQKLRNDATLGYRILGYYGDESMEDAANDAEKTTMHGYEVPEGGLERLGSLEDFLTGMAHPEDLMLGDDLFLCISRKKRDVIRSIARLCDQHVIRFYYVPVNLEMLGLNLRREFLDDIEIFATYINPLQNSVNRFLKRTFDIVLSVVALLLTGLMLPVIWLTVKIQSPGPLLFRQMRTGMNGKDFLLVKFRSMHVNKDADRLQATKDDPRKFPFGNFMRKMNIDELPQFWNVLKGDMSVVGPRPHMLAHTEMYSHLIEKYMVRHFVKPGVTGWAQVSGFRGETKELWQMEERVKRDIWYMEHWTIWLDMRIVWLTIKLLFVHDKNAY